MKRNKTSKRIENHVRIIWIKFLKNIENAEVLEKMDSYQEIPNVKVEKTLERVEDLLESLSMEEGMVAVTQENYIDSLIHIV